MEGKLFPQRGSSSLFSEMSSVLGSEGYEDGDLLTQLTRGFEALMGKVEDLVAKNARLERQVQDYHQEVSSLI